MWEAWNWFIVVGWPVVVTGVAKLLGMYWSQRDAFEQSLQKTIDHLRELLEAKDQALCCHERQLAAMEQKLKDLTGKP